MPEILAQSSSASGSASIWLLTQVDPIYPSYDRAHQIADDPNPDLLLGGGIGYALGAPPITVPGWTNSQKAKLQTWIHAGDSADSGSLATFVENAPIGVYSDSAVAALSGVNALALQPRSQFGGQSLVQRVGLMGTWNVIATANAESFNYVYNGYGPVLASATAALRDEARAFVRSRMVEACQRAQIDGTTAGTTLAVLAQAARFGISNPPNCSSVPPIYSDFALSASPVSRTLTIGGRADFAIQVSSVGAGFPASVTLTAGTAAGLTATITPPTVSAGSTATLSINAPTGPLPGGTYQIPVSGSAAGNVRSITVGVVYDAPVSVDINVAEPEPAPPERERRPPLRIPWLRWPEHEATLPDTDIDPQSAWPAPGAGDKPRLRRFDDPVGDQERGIPSLPVSPPPSEEDLEEFDRWAAEHAAAAAAQRKDSLQSSQRESTHGEGHATSAVLSEFGDAVGSSLGSLASGAVTTLYDSIVDAVATGHFAGKEFGHAMKSLAASSMKSLGAQAASKGAMEVADGVSDIANHHSGSAGEHFAAAGGYFTVAALAGISAGKLSGGKGGGAEDSKSSAVTPTGVRGSAGGEQQAPVIQRITVIGDPEPHQKKSAQA